MRKKKKTIALIAHDNKKAAMVNWALKNKTVLERFDLCGTGTTAKLVSDATELEVKRYLSGPLGGDQQIGAKIAEGKIDIVVFFWDPLESQPHITTFPPSRAAATAWFAPLPPCAVKNPPPVSVSPLWGIYGALMTRSVLILPTINIFFIII